MSLPAERIASAGEDEDDARGEEGVIENRLPEPLDDVVNIQDVIIDHSFDEVEEAPAEKERADECLARPRHIAPRPCLPQQRETD